MKELLAAISIPAFLLFAFLYARKQKLKNPPDHVRKPNARRLYSADQAAVGAFIGGPLAALFFIASNFRALDRREEFKTTLIVAGATLIGIALFLPHFSKGFGIGFAIFYTYLTYAFVNRAQMSKSAIVNSNEYALQSEATTLLKSLLYLILSVALLVILLPISKNIWPVV